MQKERKQKIPNKRLLHFSPWLQNKLTKKNWVDKGTEFGGELKKLCKTEGIQITPTTSETMAAFAARTIRSLKNILSRYMEDYGCNCRTQITIQIKTKKLIKFFNILSPTWLKSFDVLWCGCLKNSFELIFLRSWKKIVYEFLVSGE